MSGLITTFTGIRFDPTAPGPEHIDIRDIAHALPMICRGNGQVKSFYSVAQHCINCALEAEERGYTKRVRLACLLHDAGECYLSDVPRPFKQYIPQYYEYEDRLLSVIYTKFLGSDITPEENSLVREIDDLMLNSDLVNLLNAGNAFAAEAFPHIKISYEVQSFESVEKEYLELFGRLKSSIE